MKNYNHITYNTVKRNILASVCCALLALPINTRAQGSSGTDFWIMFNRNFDMSSVTLTLFITSGVNTSGLVSGPSFSSIPFNVTANQYTAVNVPASLASHTNDVVDNKGIHITALNNVTVYGLNRKAASTDAYLALPTDALGTDYTVLSYNNRIDRINNAVSLGIVGTVNGTVVTITPSVSTLSHTAGVPYNITLDQGSSYELINATNYTADLTGTRITATQPVGVFGAHACAVIGECGFCDHLCEMLPPTSAWGTKFFTIPLANGLPNGDLYRVLAMQSATTVKINGVTQTPTLNAGQFLEVNPTDYSIIEANNPVLVMQYAKGDGCSGIGDPFMTLVPPHEQFYTSTTLATVSGFIRYFVNIIAPDAIVGSLTRNGIVIPGSLFTPIGTSGFSGAQILVSPGVHTFNGSLPFICSIYGQLSYESYGYAGGQSYSPIALVADLVLTAEDSTGEACSSLCWNALVSDESSNPMEGIRVDFNIRGANSAKSGFAYTDTNGIAHFCYTGYAGLDSIIATVGTVMDTLVFTWSQIISVGTPTVSNNGPLCVGDTLDLSAAATGATSFAWTGPNSFTSALQNPSIPVTTTAVAGVYTVLINGCLSASTIVEAGAVPISPSAASNTPVCVGSTLNLYYEEGYCTPPVSAPVLGKCIKIVSTAGGITNFSNTSGCSSSSYTNYSGSMGASIAPGDPLTLTMTFSGSTIPEALELHVWVDYDDNGDFASSEKVIGAYSYVSIVTRTFVTSNFPGTHRMRVMAGKSGIGVNACSGLFYYGETEDYYLTITGVGPTYSWTGPNGFTSTLKSPSISSVTSAAAGVYTVTASTPQGCSISSTTSVVIKPQMTGTYTINSSIPTGGTNFNSFTDARNNLLCGISGPVVFNVAPSSGPYLEQVKFPAIPGTSSVNTITFNGNGNEIAFGSTTAGAPSILEMGGGDYFRFNELTISANATSNAMACHLWSGSDNNIFTNCTMRCHINNISSNTATLSISGSVNNVFTGCTIQFGYSGVVINGNSLFPSSCSGNQIINCSIQDSYRFSVFSRDNSGTVISGNTMERMTRTVPISDFYGVFVDGIVSNIVVEKNRIRNPYGSNPNSSGNATGIWHNVNLPGNENKYINNIISDFNPNGSFYGISLAGNATNTRVYHNTIYFNQPSSISGNTVMGIMNQSSASKDIRNNIVDIRRSGNGSKYLIYNNSQSGSSIYDNNNLYYTLLGGNNFTGYLQATDYITLASWQTTGNDLLSTSVDPVYTDPGSGNFLPTNPALSDIGVNVGVTTDITGAPRSTTNPDPGAYEFGVPCSLTVNAGPDESTYFGYSGDQQVTRTATVTGGTGPFTYSWTVGRALSCNTVTASGDEIFSGGTCVHNVCPTSGTLSGIASCSGSATVTVRLIDTTDVCVTVTDDNNCTATDCFTINAIDARCFAGNSQINKVYVCHYTGNNNNPWVQICIDDDAVSAHLSNNSADYLGSCNARYAAPEIQDPTAFHMYPNPAKQNISFVTSGLSGKMQLRVSNMMGQHVIDKWVVLENDEIITLDVSALVPGMYKVVLLNDMNLLEELFVKE